jgi:putative nucleotidyltransferase with HDIG domain
MAPRRATPGDGEETKHQDHLEVLRGPEGERIRATLLSLEARDPYTAGHQRRTGRLAGAIAREMCTDADEIKGVSLAAILHDVGKSCVPLRILNKSCRLNDFETSIIKGHSQSGHDLLRDIALPWPVADIVLQHHERLDGSGYPFGLEGADILPQTRILSVADVFESMTSIRPYRQPFTVDSAFSHFTENRGKLYDPQVVDALIWLHEIKGFNWE